MQRSSQPRLNMEQNGRSDWLTQSTLATLASEQPQKPRQMATRKGRAVGGREEDKEGWSGGALSADRVCLRKGGLRFCTVC